MKLSVNETTLRRVLGYAERRGVTFHSKSESWLMLTIYAVGFLWIWNRSFLTKQTTVIGRRIYWPDGVATSPTRWRTVIHEMVHVHDSSRIGSVWFYLLYLFPQCLAPLTLLSLLGGWWLLALSALAALAPWPARWRWRYESRAFKTNVWIKMHYRANPDAIRAAYIKKMCSIGTYYGMTTEDEAAEWWEQTVCEYQEEWTGEPYAALWLALTIDPGEHSNVQ